MTETVIFTETNLSATKESKKCAIRIDYENTVLSRKEAINEAHKEAEKKLDAPYVLKVIED